MGNDIKFLIQSLLSYEDDFDARLDLLTSIGIDSTNEKIFAACEEIRNELPESDKEVQIERDELLRTANKVQFCTDSDSGIPTTFNYAEGVE